MSSEERPLNPDEAAAASRLDVTILWHYAQLGLITPSAEGYSDDDLAELRRVRRLHQDLEFDHPAIEITLRLRRRIQALQAEIRRLELALLVARGRRQPWRSPEQQEWDEAEWRNT